MPPKTRPAKKKPTPQPEEPVDEAPAPTPPGPRSNIKPQRRNPVTLRIEEDPAPEPEPEEEDEEETYVSPVRPGPTSPPQDDEEEEFVTAKDVKSIHIDPHITSDKMPGQSGFVADIIEGLLWKVDDMEFAVTGGFWAMQRTEADAKIERGIARYVESAIDPAKYGVVVLAGAYIGSHALRWGIYGKAVADAKAKNAKNKGKKP